MGFPVTFEVDGVQCFGIPTARAAEVAAESETLW